MIGTPAFEELVSRIRARKEEGRDPYVLLLGQDCARAAGASLATVSEELFKYLNQSNFKSVIGPLLSFGGRLEWLSKEGQTEALNRMIAKLPRERRNAILRPFYTRLPVPLFYQDLARLIRARYFTQIFTTNFDDLLEQALSGPIGLVRGKDYVVVSVADRETISPTAPPEATDDACYPPVTIFKLHGDLTSADAVLKQEDIEEAIHRRRHMIKQELAGDLIMFGYTGESEPTEEFLPRVLRSELWWVSEEHAPPERVAASGQGRDFRTITGEAGTPGQFFVRLYEALQRAPVLKSTKGPSITQPVESPVEELMVDEDSADPDQGEAELLEGQIIRARRLLVAWQRSSPSGKNDPALAKQIEHQMREIAQLQDRYRALKTNREKVLSWVDAMVQSVGGSATVEPSTKLFLEGQRDLLHAQFASPKPDHAVIAAVLSGMTSIGSRLDVVDSNLLRGLSEFTPASNVS